MRPEIYAADETSRKNAETVLAVYEEMINQRTPREAVRRYIREDYIQHNPMIPDGNAALGEYFAHVQATSTRARVEVHKVIAVGDQVWAFVNFLNFLNDDPDDLGLVAVDIYRFDEEGKLAEHWDTAQVINDPTQAANTNGVFGNAGGQ